MITRRNNSINRKKHTNTQNTYTGVYWHKRGYYYISKSLETKNVLCGRFNNIEDALYERIKFILLNHQEYSTREISDCPIEIINKLKEDKILN